MRDTATETLIHIEQSRIIHYINKEPKHNSARESHENFHFCGIICNRSWYEQSYEERNKSRKDAKSEIR